MISKKEVKKEMEETDYLSMVNTMLYSIIADMLEQKPAVIPRLARRLLPVVANDSLSEEKKYEIIDCLYREFFPHHENDLKT